MQSALERVHFYNKAQHAEQLATVGLLGASVAHEIRNPLVSIKSFVQLLPVHYNDERFRAKFFGLISDEVSRIDRLTEQLLDLASPRTYSAARVSMNEIVDSTFELILPKAQQRDIQITKKFDAAPDLVYTDRSAAKQVLLNLCFNAIQAIESGTRRPGEIHIRTHSSGSRIELSVTDTGPGIEAAVYPRLFQPFETTKSSGFGLGLAICRDILANLDATIVADPPQRDQGATFRVNFPCHPSSS
jgi:signal transduction histidine kinase